MDESTSPDIKQCSRCKTDKPLDGFSKDRRRSDGLASYCRSCKSELYAAYNKANPEKARARSRRYAARNPDKVAERTRRWREAHPEYSAESNRRWREANPEAYALYYAENREQILAAARAWQAANAERKAETNRIWAENNPDRRSAAVRRWQKANPEKAREIAHRRRARVLAATVGEIDLDQLWLDCGGLCGICGEGLDVALQYPDPMSKSIDHIVPLALGGTHEQSNLQWAHLVCNNKKGARAT